MKNTLKFVTILLFMGQITSAQSPWTKEKGKAYMQLGFSGIFYDQAQIDGKKEKLGADFSDITLQAYSEYGITNNLEAQLIVPFKSVGYSIQNTSISKSYSGIGNLTLGLKYKVYDKSWKMSTGLQFSPRTSQYDKDSGLSTGFDATTILPYVTAGKSIGKWYYFGNIGYGYMTNDFSDYFRLNAELGYNVFSKAHIILALDTRNIVSKEKAFTENQKQWVSYLDRQTYNAIGLKFNYEFSKDKFGANFSAYGAFGNDNAPLAPSLNLGVYSKL